jgi:hypothetical protein
LARILTAFECDSLILRSDSDKTWMRFTALRFRRTGDIQILIYWS